VGQLLGFFPLFQFRHVGLVDLERFVRRAVRLDGFSDRQVFELLVVADSQPFRHPRPPLLQRPIGQPAIAIGRQRRLVLGIRQIGPHRQATARLIDEADLDGRPLRQVSRQVVDHTFVDRRGVFAVLVAAFDDGDRNGPLILSAGDELAGRLGRQRRIARDHQITPIGGPREM